MKNEQPLIPHLFRTEYRKIVAVLTGLFGFGQIEIAEDIANDTFLIAIETWGLKGLPENPTAWLYNVAKNNARNFLKRRSVFQNKVSNEIRSRSVASDEMVIDMSDQNITDSQLKMMFAICHPTLPRKAQLCLALQVLCGFGIEEIADALLSNKDTVNKTLFRAKEKLRTENTAMEMPAPGQINRRLDVVVTVIYLLFNEGYYSTSRNSVLRKEFCLEAMRLCHMLAGNKATNKPSVNALLSLMCFHTSRFEARTNPGGELVLYDDQDTSLWNVELIEQGEHYLSLAAVGDNISSYHLEAAIAYWHTRKPDTTEKWETILQLYNHLLQIEYSPIAALNRTYALSKAGGKNEAIREAMKINLKNNYFYYVLLGELHTGVDNVQAKDYFAKALTLVKTSTDKTIIQNKMKLFEMN